MEGGTSKQKYKLIEYREVIYEIPIRRTNNNNNRVVLWSDVQSIIPNATCCLNNSKLIPFQLDNEFNELVPKRILLSSEEDEDFNITVWEVHVPEDPSFNLLLQISNKVDYLIQQQIDQDQPKSPVQGQSRSSNEGQSGSSLESESESDSESQNHNENQIQIESSSQNQTKNNSQKQIQTKSQQQPQQAQKSSSSSSSSHRENDRLNNVLENETRSLVSHTVSASNRDSQTTGSSSIGSSSITISNIVHNSDTQRHEAPPSYEISMKSSIDALKFKLRSFESHVPNRHKSPKWLSNRSEWLSEEPNNIEDIALLLVQLEMALLWTAVTETWINERETWLTLVGNSRSERHLAGAILDLERHTLVMDESWLTIRERWRNELLEMIILPLSHG